MTSNVTDVDTNACYGDPIARAADKGLVNGYGSGVFVPDDVITREQMAVMLNNYIKYKEIALNKDGYIPFKDEYLISSWEKDAIADIRRYGLISGVGDNISHQINYTEKPMSTICLPKSILNLTKRKTI